MYELGLDKAKLKTIKNHRYYLFFPTPSTHKNQDNRPTVYADEKKLETYKGAGSNGSAKLLPDVLTDANALMSALREYGDSIDDWSMRSAVIQNGYRPDDESQGRNYLRIINETIANYPSIFRTAKFPETLNEAAQGVLGRAGDPRRTAFQKKVAEAPGWNRDLAQQLFRIVDNAYAPRGSNPHATGLVFDLDFSIYYNGGEIQLGAATKYNNAALQSAAGMWLNSYAMQFGFDSYDTGIEIWHLEYRRQT
ncbi:MAG TPA: hypothetical protein VFA65_15855 [Bryobacteraceae bacterium]|nr:hypothetical protein [Bryobacteraceae bacterium]